MSWKVTLKKKLPSILLLVSLIFTLCFSVYGAYKVWTTSYLTSPVNIQVSAGTEIQFQLDSETFIVIHAVGDMSTGDTHIDWTGYGGEMFFRINSVTVYFWWYGNVTNVTLDGASMANHTSHYFDDLFSHVLMWNWAEAYVPPFTEYDIRIFAYDSIDSSLIEHVNFTMSYDSWLWNLETSYYGVVTDTYTLTFTFPTSVYINETANFELYQIAYMNGTTYPLPLLENTTDNYVTFIPSGNTDIMAYYEPVGTGGAVFLLPLTFIFGMVGLACLFLGPLYGIHKIRHKEYRNGMIYAIIIFAIGFGLFISWLWH
jgi:hypothetical protein